MSQPYLRTSGKTEFEAKDQAVKNTGSIKTTAGVNIATSGRVFNGLLAGFSVDKYTGKKIDEIDRATDHDNYMNSAEAVDFGICDRVIDHIIIG